MFSYEGEGVARWVRSEVSASALALRGMRRAVAIAKGLGLRVFRVPNLIPRAYLARHGELRVIAFRASTPEPYAVHDVLHEVGHHANRICGVEDTEEGADFVAAALAMPGDEFARAVGAHGEDYAALAAAFGVTETSAALRIGEVMREPVAVVTPATVRVRGPEEWVWPDAGTVREWARFGHTLRGSRRKYEIAHVHCLTPLCVCAYSIPW